MTQLPASSYSPRALYCRRPAAIKRGDLSRPAGIGSQAEMTDTPFKPKHALPERNAAMTRPLAVLLALGAFGVTAAPAAAQSFPSRTITIVSPAPAGGVTDTIARALAQRFSTKWG